MASPKTTYRAEIMNQEILISIIIPSYNTAEFVEDSLLSVSSEFKELAEIIIIDDGSTDNSQMVIQNLIDENRYGSKFIFIQQENLGAGKARNVGLDLANGIYIGFLDSDDYYIRGIANATIQILKESTISIIEYHFCRLNHENEISLNKRFYDFEGQYEIKSILTSIFARTAWYPSIRFFKRELWNNIRFPEGVYYEDPMTIYRLYQAAEKIFFIANPFLAYRNRQGSITQSISNKKYQDLYDFVQLLDRSDPLLIIFKVRLIRTLIRFAIYLRLGIIQIYNLGRKIILVRNAHSSIKTVLLPPDRLLFLFPFLYILIDILYVRLKGIYNFLRSSLRRHI